MNEKLAENWFWKHNIEQIGHFHNAVFFRYNLTGDDVRNEARFEDSIGIFPEFIDGFNVLILPTSGRYFHVSLKLSGPIL